VAGVGPLVSDGVHRWSVPLPVLAGTGSTQRIVFHGTDGVRHDYAPDVVTLITG
jgi:hypothetical protein